MEDYTDQLRGSLGRSVVATRITGVITSVAGVYKHVNPWAADIDNAGNEWSDCTAIVVTVTGFEA